LGNLLYHLIGLHLHYQVASPAKIEAEMNVLREVLFDLRPAGKVLKAGFVVRFEDYRETRNRYHQNNDDPVSNLAMHTASPQKSVHKFRVQALACFDERTA
jgi:hypothetical protein